MCPQNVYSVDIVLAWDGIAEKDLDGYKIFRRGEGESYNYDNPVLKAQLNELGENPQEPTCTIHSLDDNITHYFVVRAFYTTGFESADSNEVCYSVDTDGDEIKQGSDPLDPDSVPAYSSWTDYRLTLTIRSVDDDAIGVMFRYQDNANYYRFSWDSEKNYRRLVKQENGEFVVLAEDTARYVPGETYELEVVADGSVLEIWIDGSLIFTVEDGSFSAGSVALYSWGNRGSYFDDVYAEDLATGAVLLSEDFNNGEFSNWNVVDEGNRDGPSAWSAGSGILVQRSNIYSAPTDAAELAKFGTFVLY